MNIVGFFTDSSWVITSSAKVAQLFVRIRKRYQHSIPSIRVNVLDWIPGAVGIGWNLRIISSKRVYRQPCSCLPIESCSEEIISRLSISFLARELIPLVIAIGKLGCRWVIELVHSGYTESEHRYSPLSNRHFRGGLRGRNRLHPLCYLLWCFYLSH